MLYPLVFGMLSLSRRRSLQLFCVCMFVCRFVCDAFNNFNIISMAHRRRKLNYLESKSRIKRLLRKNKGEPALGCLAAQRGDFKLCCRKYLGRHWEAGGRVEQREQACVTEHLTRQIVQGYPPPILFSGNYFCISQACFNFQQGIWIQMQSSASNYRLTCNSIGNYRASL